MSLRDRKRARTRALLVECAARLFERDGYDETTIADIAEAAEIGARTFFSYFAGKEDLLFPESDARVAAALAAIDTRTGEEGPAEVLLRALSAVADGGHPEITGPLAALRLRLIQTVPAVRGRALQLQLDAQRRIAGHLVAAFPDQLDPVRAGALTGAFIGAVTGALQAVLDAGGSQAQLPAALHTATEVALAPWRTHLNNAT